MALILFVLLGHEKLKMYGFYVHGCIDGGSNFVVYVVLALDKKGVTLQNAFDSAASAYGFPLCLRADMAFEALLVGQRILDDHGPGAYLTGPSTANQVRLFALKLKSTLHAIVCRLIAVMLNRARAIHRQLSPAWCKQLLTLMSVALHRQAVCIHNRF